MAAYVFAQTVLMAVWVAAVLQLMSAAKARYPHMSRSGVLAALLILASAGWLVLAMLSWQILPPSRLSLGWSREMLESVQTAAGVMTFGVAAAGFWYAVRRLLPLPAVKVPVRLSSGVKTKAKRRP